MIQYPKRLTRKLASAGEGAFFIFKNGKKTDRQTSKQPSNESRQQEPSPIIQHGKQSSYDPLMQAHSAVFCCYDQKSLPCDKKRNGS
jgi:hypothetical protein